MSEDGVALVFTARHPNTRFDHDVGRWFMFDGVYWRADNTLLAFSYAREIARELSGNAVGRAVKSSGFARGVEALARSDRAHATTANAWNLNPMLLGTSGGTVDLRSGVLQAARASDAITKLAGAVPKDGEPVIWLGFLNEATGGDTELIRFLQQWCGYCLTGVTTEHALAFIYGPGGNGKSVFLNVLTAVLGDYAATAAMETFTESRNDRHSTELAMLRGARLVTASETEAGRAWAETKVKAMTGGDPITARFMRQDNFTYVPEFKLTVVGNHAPELRNVDNAMKRRFNIVPFTRVPAKIDRDLEMKLRGELGFILSWMVAGCLDWQANGLVRPPAVVDATATYFDEQDLVAQWIEERCEIGSGLYELPTRAFKDWCEFAKQRGGDPGRIQALTPALAKHGFRSAKSNGLRKYLGLTVRASENLDDARWPL